VPYPKGMGVAEITSQIEAVLLIARDGGRCALIVKE